MVLNIRKISALFVMVTCVAMFSFLSISSAQNVVSEAEGKKRALENAQTNEDGEVQHLDPQDYQTWKKDFVPHKFEDLAFSKDQRGCSTKMAFSNMLIEKYNEGTLPAGLTESKIIQPYIEEQFALIREQGIDQARYNTMSEYQNCMKTAVKDSDPSKAYDMEQRFGACGQLNKIVLGTLDSIKKRQSMDSVIRKYENDAPDLTETTFGATEDPVPLLVGKLYQVAEEGEYNDAVALGSKMTYACYM